jgi:F0F1-type ATP synthase delta subunit
MSTTSHDVIVQLAKDLTQQQSTQLAKDLRAAFPHKRVVVLPPGVVVSHSEQLDRIEQKLDTLIAALADEQDDQEKQGPIVTLDGETVAAGDRDQTQGLD